MYQIFDVADKTVLITGSTKGLGYAFAEGFLKAGARVIVSSKTPANVESAAASLEKISDQVTGVVFDVTDPRSVKRAISNIVRKTGRIDVLINNAGIHERAPFMDMSLAQFKNVIDVNLNSVFSVSQQAAKAMEKSGGGAIINISSLNSHGARPTIANYCASKGGINMLTRSMALELAPHNIRVNAIAPGYFLTDMTKKLVEDPEFDAWVKSEVPLGRWGHPEELVGAAIFLASQASSYMNGQVLLIDGGWRSSL